MKITINSTDLSRALAAVSRCIGSKSVVPILECFHIKAVGEELYITGSDNENWFTVTVHPTDITYLDDGFDHAFCIESKRFLAVIRELSSQPIGLELSADHTYATLRWLNGEAQLPIMMADGYPCPAESENGVAEVCLSASSLRNIIETCSFATANDELRPVMNGIYFDHSGESLTCCATNGHQLVRLTQSDVPVPAESFILAARSAGLLGTLIAEAERHNTKKESPAVRLSVNGCNIAFRSEQACLVCRMIDGRYPNYNSVIPKNSPYEMTLSRADLISSLRRTMVFANPASLLIKMSISADKLTISAADIDFFTSSEETLPCSFNGRDGFFIGFKGSFLLDMLNHMSSNEVTVQLTDHSRAGVFLPREENGEQELLMLLMPMMLQE